MVVECHNARIRSRSEAVQKKHYTTGWPRKVQCRENCREKCTGQGIPIVSNPLGCRATMGSLVCTTLAHVAQAPHRTHMRPPAYPRSRHPRSLSSGSSPVQQVAHRGHKRRTPMQCNTCFAHARYIRFMLAGAWGFPWAGPMRSAVNTSQQGGVHGMQQRSQTEERAGLLGHVQHIMSWSVGDGERGFGKSGLQ